jgi:hypothetical protein
MSVAGIHFNVLNSLSISNGKNENGTINMDRQDGQDDVMHKALSFVHDPSALILFILSIHVRSSFPRFFPLLLSLGSRCVENNPV